MKRAPAIIAVALLGALLNGPSQAAETGKFVDLGPQVTATTIQGSLVVRDDAGRDVVFTVARGEPAHLLAFAIETGERVLDVPLPGTDGVWNLTLSSDGWLYIPSANGRLLRHRPGTRTVEDLGQALPTETVIWDVVAGQDGEVFGGTYPGGRVFRYHPKDGFSDASRGPLVAGENYCRGLAYHPATGKVYAGIGAHAHLIELDPKTGQKRELLPKKYRDQESVYSLGLLPDAVHGDRLLALVANANVTLVYNLKTDTVERVITSPVSVKTAAKAPDGGRVYYSDGTKLTSFDLEQPGEAPKGIVRCIGANAMRWLSPDRLCVLTRYAQLLTYTPSTGKTEMKALEIPPQPIPIHGLALGPDGRIWMGGFLAGGNAAYDPATGKTELFKGMSQTEQMAVMGNKIYYGIYPHARFHVYDTTRPWDASKDNPRKLAQWEGQSRPVAMVGVEELNKVFVGTVPEYGRLGGALITYDAKTDRTDVREGVVPKQSVVSLAWSHGTLVGGTSVTGGLGQVPEEKEGRLFLWDPAQNEKTFETTPVPGTTAVTCLINGPDGKVWGVADGTLFLFDVDKREVVSRHKLFDVDYAARNYNVWRDAFLVVHPSGQLYGVLDGKFFRLDPTTKAVTVLRERGAELLTMDRDGRLYFRVKERLWQYVP
jgi:WD40 repeat protein